MDAILTSPVGGVLDSIKELTVTLVQPDAQEKQFRNLLRLVSVLPRDGLTHLNLVGVAEQDVVGLILRTQTQIQELKFFIKPNGQTSPPPNASCVWSSLVRLEILKVLTKDEKANKFACWTPHMLSL
jgi:hypothetical protein